MKQEVASVLGVVIDLSGDSWDKVKCENEPMSPLLAIQSTCVFINAFCMLNRDNEVFVVAHFPDGTSQWLGKRNGGPSNKYFMEDMFHKLRQCVEIDGARSGLASALMKSLCILNQQSTEYKRLYDTTPECRLLVVHATADEPSHYVQCMNVAFAAQKHGVTIDVCDFSPDGSTILQQVSHLSGGLLQHLKEANSPSKFTEVLLCVFLANKNTRMMLKLPPAAPIILQAVCLCHGVLKDRGFVCSMCLSVLCREPVAVCPTCRTRKHVNL